MPAQDQSWVFCPRCTPVTVFLLLERLAVYCRPGEANATAYVPTIVRLYFQAGHRFVLLLSTLLFVRT